MSSENGAFLALWALLIIPTAILLVWNLLSSIVSLLYNIYLARKSGLPFVVLPYYNYNFVRTKYLGNRFLRFVNKYSYADPPITSWRCLADGLWPLKLRHAPFAQLGTDTFLTVSPGGIVVNTADADVITQIIERPYSFPKATQLYKAIAVYGQNVVSAEGDMWKRHRKLTSHAFSERNNQLVWATTLRRSQSMVSSWVNSGNLKRSVQEVRDNTTQLSLEILGKAALGQQIDWVAEQTAGQTSSSNSRSRNLAASLKYTCDNILSIVPAVQLAAWVPKFLLPKTLRKKHGDYEEWGCYMKKMLAAKRKSPGFHNTRSSGIDIIGQLLKEQEESIGMDHEGPLTDQEVMGNLFLFIIAGHETSSSSLFLSILLLALHPSAQKAVQQELDEIFGGRSPSDWNYEEDLPRLLNGQLGAVLNEQLRLQSPTPTIPKVVCSTPQHVLVEGKYVTFPANSIIRICSQAIHTNPRFWPHDLPENSSKPAFQHNNPNNDLGEFKPARWATSSSPNGYKPYPGSFLPFSLGQRNCLGKRFAQIEIVTALAVLFSQYSIELDISSHVPDDILDYVRKEDKFRVWKTAQEKAQMEWRTKVTCLITVQMTKDAKIPLRLVKRGEEQFFDLD